MVYLQSTRVFVIKVGISGTAKDSEKLNSIRRPLRNFDGIRHLRASAASALLPGFDCSRVCESNEFAAGNIRKN